MRSSQVGFYAALNDVSGQPVGSGSLLGVLDS